MPDPGMHRTTENSLRPELSAPKTLKCRWENCEATFNSGEELYKHICDDHTVKSSRPHPSGSSKRVFHCRWDDCKIRVNKRDHLVSHVRVHVDIWPYSCEMCDRKFRRPQDLKKHLGTSLHQQVEALGLEKVEQLNNRNRKSGKAASPNPSQKSPRDTTPIDRQLSQNPGQSPEIPLNLIEDPVSTPTQSNGPWGSEDTDPKSEAFSTTDLYTNQYVDLYMDQFREGTAERSPQTMSSSANTLFPGLEPSTPYSNRYSTSPHSQGSSVSSQYRGSLPDIKQENGSDLYSQYSAELSGNYPIVKRNSTVSTQNSPQYPPRTMPMQSSRQDPKKIDVSNFPESLFADLRRNDPPPPRNEMPEAYKIPGISYSPQTGVNPYAIWGSRNWRQSPTNAPHRSPLINVPPDLHELWNLPSLPVGIMPSQRDAPPPTPESLHQDRMELSQTSDRESSPSQSPLTDHESLDSHSPLTSHSPSLHTPSSLRQFSAINDDGLSYVTPGDLERTPSSSTISLTESPSLHSLQPLTAGPSLSSLDLEGRGASRVRTNSMGHLPTAQFRRPSMTTRGPQLFERIMPSPSQVTTPLSYEVISNREPENFPGSKIPVNRPNQRVYSINEQRSMLYERRDFRTRQYNYYTADLDPEGFYSTPIQPIAGASLTSANSAGKKRHMKQESMDRVDFEGSARRLANQQQTQQHQQHNHRSLHPSHPAPSYVNDNGYQGGMLSSSSQGPSAAETPLRATRSFYSPGSTMTPPISDGKSTNDGGRLTRRRSHPANIGRSDSSVSLEKYTDVNAQNPGKPSFRFLKNGTRMAKDFLSGIDFNWKKNVPGNYPGRQDQQSNLSSLHPQPSSQPQPSQPQPSQPQSSQLPPSQPPSRTSYHQQDMNYGQHDVNYRSPVDSDEGKKVMRIKRMKSTEFPQSNYGQNLFDREIFLERRSSKEDSSDQEGGDDSETSRHESNAWNQPYDNEDSSHTQ